MRHIKTAHIHTRAKKDTEKEILCFIFGALVVEEKTDLRIKVINQQSKYTKPFEKWLRHQL